VTGRQGTAARSPKRTDGPGDARGRPAEITRVRVERLRRRRTSSTMRTSPTPPPDNRIALRQRTTPAPPEGPRRRAPPPDPAPAGGDGAFETSGATPRRRSQAPAQP